MVIVAELFPSADIALGELDFGPAVGALDHVLRASTNNLGHEGLRLVVDYSR